MLTMRLSVNQSGSSGQRSGGQRDGGKIVGLLPGHYCYWAKWNYRNKLVGNLMPGMVNNIVRPKRFDYSQLAVTELWMCSMT